MQSWELFSIPIHVFSCEAIDTGSKACRRGRGYMSRIWPSLRWNERVFSSKLSRSASAAPEMLSHSRMQDPRGDPGRKSLCTFSSNNQREKMSEWREGRCVSIRCLYAHAFFTQHYMPALIDNDVNRYTIIERPQHVRFSINGSEMSYTSTSVTRAVLATQTSENIEEFRMHWLPWGTHRKEWPFGTAILNARFNGLERPF